VLDVQEDKALLITEEVIGKQPYNDYDDGIHRSGYSWEYNTSWESCTLRRYLNDEFLQKFTPEQQNMILEADNANPDNLWYDMEGGNSTLDKIFLLSLEEADRYFGNSEDYAAGKNNAGEISNEHDADRQAKDSSDSVYWWLRSPGSESFCAAFIKLCGSINVMGEHSRNSLGVRPALWLNLKSDGERCSVDAENTEDVAVSVLQGEKRNLPFGKYKWRVLDVQEDKALLITESVIEKRPYHESNNYPLDRHTPWEKWSTVTFKWESCTLRHYLNEEFLQGFTSRKQNMILETDNANPENLWYGTGDGNSTQDKIFLLNLNEVDKYFGNSGDYESGGEGYGGSFCNEYDGDRQAKDAESKFSPWWLRSTGDRGTCAAYVGSDGGVSVTGAYADECGGGVRPALWLDLTKRK
jgi:hypothetical protein